MGWFDGFRRRKAPEPQERRFFLEVDGFGVTARLQMPCGVAHLEGSKLLVGPYSLDSVPADQERVENAILVPGAPPTARLVTAPTAAGEIVRIGSGEPGTTELALGANVASMENLLSRFELGGQEPSWTLRTDDHAVIWPEGLTLFADGILHPTTWPYEFRSPGFDDEMVWLQGPLSDHQIPHPEVFIEPPLELYADGDFEGAVNTVIWLENWYEHDDEIWHQRIYYLPMDSERIYLLRAQATENRAQALFDRVDLMARSFKPRS